MTHFFKHGDIFTLASEDRVEIHDKLPVANYIVKINPQNGEHYLEKISSFTQLGKIYGNALQRAERIINSYEKRTSNTGALFVGEKGSGKTLLTKLISLECAKRGIPTIIVNTPWKGDNFNRFMQQIEQPCMVLFDEFEKVFNYQDQEAILTLLDGVFPSKKLFVITCNEKHRIDKNMKNRPGRIFYLLEFYALEAEFIREYCTDNLINKDLVEEVIRITKVLNNFNFDMLSALVEEINRYKETPVEALAMLNIKPMYEESCSYEVELVIDGNKLDKKEFYPNNIQQQPFSSQVIEIYHRNNSQDEPDDCYEFEPKDLKKFDSVSNQLVYELTENGSLVNLYIKKRETFQINPWGLAA